MADPTHVLHWVPGCLVKSSHGWWELQDIAEYDAGVPQLHPDWLIAGEGRDLDAADFAGWIAGLVGYPVIVEKSWARITCPHPEPLFYVSPRDVPDVSTPAGDLPEVIW